MEKNKTNKKVSKKIVNRNNTVYFVLMPDRCQKPIWKTWKTIKSLVDVQLRVIE